MSFCVDKVLRRLIVSLFLASLLSACGQKGDLYHSEDKETAISATHLFA